MNGGYGIIFLYFYQRVGRKGMLFLKIVFCILLCVPLAFLAVALFSNLMDAILKKR